MIDLSAALFSNDAHAPAIHRSFLHISGSVPHEISTGGMAIKSDDKGCCMQVPSVQVPRLHALSLWHGVAFPSLLQLSPAQTLHSPHSQQLPVWAGSPPQCHPPLIIPTPA